MTTITWNIIIEQFLKYFRSCIEYKSHTHELVLKHVYIHINIVMNVYEILILWNWAKSEHAEWRFHYSIHLPTYIHICMHVRISFNFRLDLWGVKEVREMCDQPARRRGSGCALVLRLHWSGLVWHCMTWLPVLTFSYLTS